MTIIGLGEETSASPAGAKAAIRSAWMVAIGGVALLWAGIAWSHWDAFSAAIKVWMVSPTFTHCFVVPLIVAWLVWRKRADLAGVQPRLEPLALLLLLPLVMAALLGRLVSVLEAQQFAAVGMMQASLLLLLGWPVIRVILFPVAFLAFMVPTGAYLIGPLQAFTTDFIRLWLEWLHIPAYVEGTMIELSTGRFEVAEACAGLRFLIVNITIGTLFSYLSFARWWKHIAFVSACLAVPVIANGFRALGIVLIAHATDNKVAVGADHLVYGWIFTVVVMMALLAIGWRMRDAVPAADAPVAGRSGPPRPTRFSPILAVIFAALALIAIDAGFEAWRSSQPVPGAAQSLALSATNPDLAASGPARYVPRYQGFDARRDAQWHNLADPTAPPVDIALLYYAHLRRGHELVTSENRLVTEEEGGRVISRGARRIELGDRAIRGQAALIEVKGERRLVWSWYWASGRYRDSALAVKLAQALGSFGGDSSGAFITVSTPVDTRAAAEARLAKAAAALTDLSATLTTAAQADR